MLIPQDQSVGWFKEAIHTATENRIIIAGRIAFISAETGKHVKGNNKGSQLRPFSKQQAMTWYIEQGYLIKSDEMSNVEQTTSSA